MARTRGANICKYVVEWNRTEDKKDRHRSDPFTATITDHLCSPCVHAFSSPAPRGRYVLKVTWFHLKKKTLINYNAIHSVKIFKYNSSRVIPRLKISRKYYTTAGCDNHSYQTTSCELLRGLRSTATVTVRGGQLHLHVPCYTSCLRVTLLQSS